MIIEIFDRRKGMKATSLPVLRRRIVGHSQAVFIPPFGFSFLLDPSDVADRVENLLACRVRVRVKPITRVGESIIKNQGSPESFILILPAFFHMFSYFFMISRGYHHHYIDEPDAKR